MADFELDRFYLYIQIIVLMAIPAREFFRKQRRNLYAILIPLTMLILVQGQAWWMLEQFEADNLTTMQHLYQNVSSEGFRRANLYACLSVISLAITYSLLSLRRISKRTEVFRLPLRPLQPSVHSFLIAILVLSFALTIITISGGFESAITNPGLTLVHGLVFFLMLLWLGKLPVLNNIASGRRSNWLDAALFTLVTIVFLFNSRFLAFFILLQWWILHHYCRRETHKKTIVATGIVFFLIFFLFGMYRHYVPQYETILPDLSFDFIVELFSFKSLLDWFYSLNIEGFAGLAGLLTHEANQGGINHDFGLSNIAALFQFIPSSLRYSENLPFGEMKDFFSSLYPYAGSVVPSGIENAYAHFGIIGLVGFGSLLGILMVWLHDQMLNPKADRLMIAILSVHVLQLIRGSFYLVTFFVLSEIIILSLYRLMLKVPKILAVCTERHGQRLRNKGAARQRSENGIAARMTLR